MSARASDAASLARRAADIAEAALDAEKETASIPDGIRERLMFGVAGAREATNTNGDEQLSVLKNAQRSLVPPPTVFLPTELTRALESARGLLERAIHATSA